MIGYQTILIGEGARLFVSEVLEPLPSLLKLVSLSFECQRRFGHIRSEIRRRQFLTARVLIKEAGLDPESLFYGENGKPYFKGSDCVSISHSGSFVGILVSTSSAGLDIECVDSRMDRLAPRFCHSNELSFLGVGELIRKTVIWSAKEAVYKLLNIKGVDFRADIQIKPFLLTDRYVEVTYQGEVNILGMFKVLENYVVVVVFYAEDVELKKNLLNKDSAV